MFPLNETVSIYQFKRTGNTESYQDDPTYENVDCLITPIGTDIQTTYGDVAAYQLFEVFLYDMTIQIKNADRVVTASGVTYEVDGQPYVADNPFLQYIRCECRKVV